LLHFGFASAQIPDEKYLTFTPGQFKFKVIDKDSFESEEVTATVYARTPTIGNITPQNIVLPYNGSANTTIVSGSNADAPGAKDFISSAKIRLESANSSPNESLPVSFDATTFSLVATIPAQAVRSFVKGQDENLVALPDIDPNPYTYRSFISVLNTTPYLGSGKNATSKPSPVYFQFTYPSPSITSVQPPTIPADDSRDTVVTITGTNFISNETLVYIEQRNGPPLGFGGRPQRTRQTLQTTVVSPTQINVTIPTSLRNTARKDTLVVFNGTFSSGNAAVVEVIPTPLISRTKPDTLAAYIYGEQEPTDTVITITGKYLDSTIAYWNQDTTLVLPILPGRTTTMMQVVVPITIYPHFFPIDLRSTSGLYSLSLRYPNKFYGTASTPIRLIYADAVIDTVRPDTIEIPVSAAFLALKDDASLTSGNGRRGESPVYAGLPITVELFPNAPNPFDGQTTIEYAVPDDATLGIEIYDPLGKRIADLVPRKLHKAGFYSVQWNAGHQTASGIYTAVLQSIDGKGKLTRKTIRMTLIR
jgi:hypothetical protein